MREHRTHSWSRSILIALLVALVSLGGCSFLVMHAPRRGYEPAQGPPDCIESPLLPGLEGAGAATGMSLTALAFLTESFISFLWWDCDEDGCVGRNADHGLSLRISIPTAILAASSLYGVRQAKVCRRAHDRYRASIHSALPDPAGASSRP